MSVVERPDLELELVRVVDKGLQIRDGVAVRVQPDLVPQQGAQ